jgi:uncharacterized membrane protein
MRIFLGIIGIAILGIGVRSLINGTFMLENVLPSIPKTAGNLVLIVIGFILVAYGFKNYKGK